MVVFTNGVSARAEYRKFKMTNQRNDDTGNIYETIFRRFSEKNQKSWGVPDLILIDGGKGQLEAAIRALQERDVRVPIVSIAKRIEEIVVHQTNSFVNVAKLRERADVSVREEGSFVIVNLHPGQTKSHGHALNLRGDGANYTYDDVTRLFQRIRDESHRFAISYHTVLRKTEQTKNTLEEIPGIGPKTRAKLLKKFGSLAGVKAATTQELSIIIGETRAQAVRQFLDT
jgi:excinuclease ABC subunit C